MKNSHVLEDLNCNSIHKKIQLVVIMCIVVFCTLGIIVYIFPLTHGSMVIITVWIVFTIFYSVLMGTFYQYYKSRFIAKYTLMTAILVRYRERYKISTVMRTLESDKQFKKHTLWIRQCLVEIEKTGLCTQTMQAMSSHYLMKTLASLISVIETHGDENAVRHLDNLELDLESWRASVIFGQMHVLKHRLRLILLILVSIAVASFSLRMFWSIGVNPYQKSIQNKLVWFIISQCVMIIYCLSSIKPWTFAGEDDV